MSQYSISPKPSIPTFQYSLAQTWLAGPEFSGYRFQNITATAAFSREVAPGQANIPIVSEAN
jgi:hypothetical protein